MRFAPLEEPIELYKTGFGKDILGRETIGKTLSEIVDRTEDPLVIALDGAWGTGKSYFLKRWVGAHGTENAGKAQSVYFDAFANDYLSDPLISLLAEIGHRITPSKFEKIKSAASKLLKPALKAGLAVVSSGATEVAGAVGDAAIKVAETESANAINQLWKAASGRQDGMRKFREALEKLTTLEGEEAPTPLVIVIDELDRCRPDYALELLEVIKHFFAVPRVHFVLGVNLEALESIVQTRYGSSFNARTYLQKFLSFTLSLPQHLEEKRISASAEYARSLFKNRNIPNQFSEECVKQIGILSSRTPITMRDVDKIVSSSTILPTNASSDTLNRGYQKVLVTLVILKIIAPEIYKKLGGTPLTERELRELLGVTDQNSQRYIIDEAIPPSNFKRISNPDFEGDRMLLYWIWASISGIATDESKTPPIGISEYFGYVSKDEIPGILKHCRNWADSFNIPL